MAQTAGGTYYAASTELVSSWPATSLDLANQLETRFAAKLDTPPAYATTWTATYSQVATLTKSAETARFRQTGKIVRAWGTATFSNAGTANNMFLLTSLPVAALAGGTRSIGTGAFYDSSAATLYNGMLFWVSNTEIRFIGDWAGASALGVSPNIAVANGDGFIWQLNYEAA